MKRLILTFLITGCGMSLCSPVISANAPEESSLREGRYLPRFS